jgi:putative DNA primase/helicase
MKYDGPINIATGSTAGTAVWKNRTLKYSAFVDKLREAHYTNETFKEFMNASKGDQGKIKDVGGYVGGYLRQGKRSPSHVAHRQIATLDIDFAHLDFWSDFTLMFGNAACIHGTHKHCDASPRYRLILPLSREASPDEYVAVTRQLAGWLGIDLFDNTTFETNRLMFWPSSPKDVDYYFEEQDGPWLDVDEVLASYIDWTDTSLWPTAAKQVRAIGEAAQKQEDPCLKKGIVGTFCRTFGITAAIDAFLKDEYLHTDKEDRFTYTKGSTAAGLIVYEDVFAFSHHGTDPCSGKTSNAFDLVRLHKFGHLDEGSVSGQKPKSFAAMEELALKNKEVKKAIAAENLAAAKYDYAQDYDDLENVEGDQDNVEWMEELEADSKGKYLSSSTNINTILEHDVRLKDCFKQNDFDGKRYVCKTLPWRVVSTPEPIKDVDYAGIRNYIESLYGIAGVMKIEDSVALEFERKSFHPVRDYFKTLKWDGIPRVDRLLIDYFGAEDTIYTRETIRKQLVGSVARILSPGCKFDLSMTLVGEEGTYKSSFIKILGKTWYSDTFMTVHGKEAFEQIQGVWLMEIAELSGFRKSDAEAVKHFLTKQEDSFRPAYGRTSVSLPRQTTFWPTTNKLEFLNDPTGGRRFNPILVRKAFVTRSIPDELPDEVDQIWAEAIHLYKQGETLYLSAEAAGLAKAERVKHSETDERKGIIEAYLDAALPKKWSEMDLHERRSFLESGDLETGEPREVVCMAEIWCECLGKEKENMTRYNTKEVNDVMRGLDDWVYCATTKNFGYYGKQKYYKRASAT